MVEMNTVNTEKHGAMNFASSVASIELPHAGLNATYLLT
jgi:hypothetical protein